MNIFESKIQCKIDCRCVIENQCTFYPWVHQYVNNLSRGNQIEAVTFPDVSPTKFPPKGTMNMVAGDFLQVLGQHPQNNHDCLKK